MFGILDSLFHQENGFLLIKTYLDLSQANHSSCCKQVAYAYQLISRLNEGSMISSLLEANQIDRQPQIVHTRH